jgi:hypothetical protein
MKPKIIVGISMLAIAGCATRGPFQPMAPAGSSYLAPTTPNAAVPTSPDAPAFPPKSADLGPHLVMPFTGGPPVMAMPLGGNLFQPLTGGAPIPGTSISP